MADYIVDFLLPIPGWFMIIFQLTYIEDGAGPLLVNGFTMHCWVLPDKLVIEVYKRVGAVRQSIT